MTHDYFKDYREAHDDMLEDVNIPKLQNDLDEAQTHLDAVLNPYRERMRQAEEGIHVITIDQQRTVVLHGIEAMYVKPRKSTKWKAVALTFEPAPELIEEHSTVGSPSVRISVHEVLDLED